MNYETACQILEISFVPQYEIDNQIIVKQYRKLSLKYHPDKNDSLNAADEFRKLHDAKVFLETFLDNQELEEELEDESFDEFFKNVINNNKTVNFLYNLLNTKAGKYFVEKLGCACEEQFLYFATTMDIKLLKKVYVIIIMYRDKWGLSEEFINRLYSILDERQELE